MNWIKKNKLLLAYFLLAITLCICSAAIKFKSGEINYVNSDATWHTLLTIKAYDETPISTHHFVPLVTLGSPDDKFLEWGATIPDDEGYFYYTSFAAIGYVLPWAFFKIFNLPLTEDSLYLFNTILYILSSCLWILFLFRFFSENKYRTYLMGLGTLCVIFSPEIFHGMGIVYWHQSIMQVTLLIQLLAYHSWKTYNSSAAKKLFFAMVLINPLIEWTGYPVNIGYALVELFKYRKENPKEAKKNILWAAGLSCLAFALFTIHYLTVIPPDEYFITVAKRFFSRSAASYKITRFDLTLGYINSFLAWWGMLALMLGWLLVRNKKVEFRNGMYIFILLFFAAENVIMKAHAIQYTYDRMKMVFLMSFILCDLMSQILESEKSTKKVAAVLFFFAIGVSGFNLFSYTKDQMYTWKTDYRGKNTELASYISEHYPNAIYSTDIFIRGYMNLLINRNVYEFGSIDNALEIALDKGRRYAIQLTFDPPLTINEPLHYSTKKDKHFNEIKYSYNLLWGLFRLEKVDIIDIEKNEHTVLSWTPGDNGHFGDTLTVSTTKLKKPLGRYCEIRY